MAKRSGGRKARLSRPSTVESVPYVNRKTPPHEILDADGLEAIERTSDRILSEIGVEVRDDPESLNAFRLAGARIDGQRVYLEPGFCQELIANNAPRTFTQHARNPERSVEFGGNSVVFAPAYGPPFVRAKDIERRYATFEDFQSIIKIVYQSPWMHHSGGTVCEPVNVPVDVRHLDMVHAHLTLSDKPYMGGVTSGERAEDSIQMTRLVFGKKFVANNCCILGLININSPLVLDGTMLQALRAYAKAGQATVITPFVIGGAAGPVTSAGMLAQSHAETLAGMALTQLINPGVPVMYGYLSTGLNMRTGAPIRYDETWISFSVAGQLARRVGVPFRCGSATTTAKIPDYQGGLETALGFQAAFQSGANLMIHASGSLEGGLCVDLDRLVLDCEMIGMTGRYAEGLDVSESALAFDAIKQAGPGGNFLQTDHTLERYETAFFESTLFDDSSFEQWRDEGSLDAVDRAHLRRLELLRDYEAPAMEQGLSEALAEFVATRKYEILPRR